jgi:hypothetical protein
MPAQTTDPVASLLYLIIREWRPTDPERGEVFDERLAEFVKRARVSVESGVSYLSDERIARRARALAEDLKRTGDERGQRTAEDPAVGHAAEGDAAGV